MSEIIVEYDKSYLLKSLLRFGFTLDTAEEICQSIDEEIFNLQTPAYWANRHVDHQYVLMLAEYPGQPYSYLNSIIRSQVGNTSSKNNTCACD